MVAITVSSRGSRCVQNFTTNFGWSCLFPMKLKKEAHEALSLIFQLDRVPPAIIGDHTNEIVLAEFTRKLKEASCHLRQIEPVILWANAAEKEIKELKKGSNMKQIKFFAPNKLWDDPLGLESYIRSNTIQGIYKLDGNIPETIM